MPLPFTVSCFSKIETGFTFLMLAHPGSPGQRAVKRVCVCVICYNFGHTIVRRAGDDGCVFGTCRSAGGRYANVTAGLRIKNATLADDGEYTCRAEVEADGRYDERKIAVAVHSQSPRVAEDNDKRRTAVRNPASTHVPYGITQCYLSPGRGGIPALTPAEAGTRLSDPGGRKAASRRWAPQPPK